MKAACSLMILNSCANVLPSRIVKKKPPPEETAFTALVWIGKPGGMLMQGVSVRSLSFPAKGGGICLEEASKIT